MREGALPDRPFKLTTSLAEPPPLPNWDCLLSIAYENRNDLRSFCLGGKRTLLPDWVAGLGGAQVTSRTRSCQRACVHLRDMAQQFGACLVLFPELGIFLFQVGKLWQIVDHNICGRRMSFDEILLVRLCDIEGAGFNARGDWP